MIEKALEAGIIVGVMGAIIGIIITISSKIFFVKEDERILIIHDLLPSFNCGSCGTAGCMDFAKSLINKENTIIKCRPCKRERREEIELKLLELGIKKE